MSPGRWGGTGPARGLAARAVHAVPSGQCAARAGGTVPACVRPSCLAIGKATIAHRRSTTGKLLDTPRRSSPMRRPNTGNAAMLNFAGKVVIVTGAGCVGPGWGNGKATAVLFARQGASMFAIDIDES